MPASTSAPMVNASAKQLLWLSVALLLVAFLFAEEFVHYVVATDAGGTDYVSVSAVVHPQCKEISGKYVLLCPLNGYNSVELQCDHVNCSFRNPNAPPVTEADRELQRSREKSDQIASLAVEEPYSHNNPEWQQYSINLARGDESVSFHSDYTKVPQTPEEAMGYINERSLTISRKAAQEWLDQHAK